jgi:hypothetical protein
MCQLTLTSVSWSTDFVKVHQVFMIRYICSLPYNLGWLYLVLTLIMEGTSLAGRHVSTDFDLSFMVYWSTSFNVHTLIMEIELHACLLVKHVSPDLDLIFMVYWLKIMYIFFSSPCHEKWAFAITWHPSSVNFSHFNLLLWNPSAIWTETW